MISTTDIIGYCQPYEIAAQETTELKLSSNRPKTCSVKDVNSISQKLVLKKGGRTGGTGINLGEDKHIVKANPATKQLCNIVDQGRVGLYAVAVCT